MVVSDSDYDPDSIPDLISEVSPIPGASGVSELRKHEVIASVTAHVTNLARQLEETEFCTDHLLTEARGVEPSPPANFYQVRHGGSLKPSIKPTSHPRRIHTPFKVSNGTLSIIFNHMCICTVYSFIVSCILGYWAKKG